MPKGRLRAEPADVRLIIHDSIPVPPLDVPTIDDARGLADRVQGVIARTVDTLQNDTIAGSACM
jgi:hypothetical protein